MTTEPYDAHSTTDQVTAVRDGRVMVTMTVPQYFAVAILELLDDELDDPKVSTDVHHYQRLRIMQERFARVNAMFKSAPLTGGQS